MDLIIYDKFQPHRQCHLLHLLHNDVDLHGDDVTMLMLGTVSKHLSVYFRDIQIVIQFES